MRAKVRRNVVVVTMAVLVCAAVALNWRFTQNQAAEGAAEETGTKILGEAKLVSGGEGSEEETAALLLQANGSIGRALALSDPRTLAPILRNRERCEALLACLADRRADEIMTAIYGWDTKRDAVCDILADLHLAVRDLVLLKRAEDIRTVFFTDRDAAADLADRFTSRALIRLYDAVWKARGALESNGNVRLTLTRMAQEISHA